jgi:predicted Zn finger-like uncharacterized protein
MIVACPSCSARFQYDEARFQGVQSKRFKCPKCSGVFEVVNPALAETGNTVPPPPSVPTPTPMPIPIPIPPQEGGLLPGQATSIDPSAVSGELARETTAKRDRNSLLAAAGLTESLPAGIRFSLAFLSGAMASTVRILDKPQTVIGREEGDLITHDPETSRRHAMVEIHADGTVWLTDLNSTNGTFVDGVQIYGTVPLHDRQEFTCGQSTFMLLIRREETSME